MHCAVRLLLGMLLSIGAATARADLVASPPQLDFQLYPVGTTSEPRATTLTNTGNQALTIAAIAPVTAPAGVFARAGGSCGAVPFTLAPQASCTVAHTFTPNTVDTFYETQRVTMAGGGTLEFGLRGEGDIARLDISPRTVIFPDTPVGTIGPERTVQVKNIGPVPAQITGYTTTSVPAVSAFVLTGGTCPTPPFPLNPQALCTLSYTFFPGREGESTMSVDVRTFGGSFPLDLLGMGLPETALFADGFEIAAPVSLQ